MKFEDIIAQGMNQVLNSKEHASLFKKAYKQDSDHAWADDNHADTCKSCHQDADNCMCGDGNMAKDRVKMVCPKCETHTTGDVCHKCGHNKHTRKKHHESTHYEPGLMPELDEPVIDLGDEEDEDAEDLWADDASLSSKKVMALNVALENLLKASAALDYCGLGKGSELTIKVATLISEAKKGKVDLTGKREESAKKHLRKLRELAEEESSLPKGRGESKSTPSKPAKKSKKPVSKKK